MRLENPLKFGSDLWDPSHRFETSWLLPPYVLCAIRATFGVYGILVNLIQVGYYCTHPATYGGCAVSADEFSYFTVLTYWGLAFYNLTAAVHTFTYARSGSPLIDRFPRPLQALHAFYYTTITVYPFIVTAVYWGVIFPGTWYTHEFDAFSNLSQHASNSFFALFEIIIPRTPAPLWIHAWWLVFVLALYLSLAFVTYYTKGFYPYTFLDIQTQGSAKVAIYIICIAIAAVILFSIVKGAIHLRLWLTERKAGMDGRFA
ncbi:hypothetical protein BD289DRAFT_354713, partial [Coniella lustricola]